MAVRPMKAAGMPSKAAAKSGKTAPKRATAHEVTTKDDAASNENLLDPVPQTKASMFNLPPIVESQTAHGDLLPDRNAPRATTINESDAIIVDLSTSCTKDVAVAKLLGWMRGPIRRRHIVVTEDGIPLDQMPYLHTLEGSLADQLSELRAAAQRRLFEAFEAYETDADDAATADGIADVEKCDGLIYKAAQYMRDIDDELAMDAQSQLKIDRAKSEESDDVHITLTSLNSWASAKYGVAVVEVASDSNAVPKKTNGVTKALPKVDSTFDEDMLSKSLETVYATFGFLLAAYAATNTNCIKAGKVNASGIATELVNQLEGNLKAVVPGQKDQTIRKTFARCIAAMDSKLKEARSDHATYLKALLADSEGARMAE